VVKLGPRVALSTGVQTLKRIDLTGDASLFRVVLPANVSHWSTEAVCLWFQSIGH
jgi:hypothetical protein